MRYYLAYGSNLNVEQMKYRCPNAVAVDTATIRGWELSFKGSRASSFLTIDKNINGEVPVAVWAITDADEAALDHYEGFPKFYYKREFVLRFDKTGERHRCFAYIMRNDAKYGLPTHTYYNVCAEGYRHFGFDEKYLEEAIKLSSRRYNAQWMGEKSGFVLNVI